MPDRLVRTGILTSDSVNKLSWSGEVFYRRLMNVVDDFGRYDGRHEILRSQLYPLKLGTVSASDISSWIAECEKAGIVRSYTVNGRGYIEIIKFNQRLRAAKSKWPPPADICCQPHADAVKCIGDGIGDGDGIDNISPNGSDEPIQAKPKRFRRALSDEEFISSLKNNSAYSHLNVDEELARMDAWLLVNPSRQKTRRFIVNWLNRKDKPLGKVVAIKPIEPEMDKPKIPEFMKEVRDLGYLMERQRDIRNPDINSMLIPALNLSREALEHIEKEWPTEWKAVLERVMAKGNEIKKKKLQAA